MNYSKIIDWNHCVIKSELWFEVFVRSACVTLQRQTQKFGADVIIQVVI